MTGPIRVRTYSAASAAEAARLFEVDAAEAAKAGFIPASQTWEGSSLTVVYQRSPSASAAPTVAAPADDPPAAPPEGPSLLEHRAPSEAHSLPLHHAAGFGTETVVAAIADGADIDAVDAAGQTALFVAARTGSLDVAAILLDAGVPRDAVAADGSRAADHATDELRAFLVEVGGPPFRGLADMGFSHWQLVEPFRRLRRRRELDDPVPDAARAGFIFAALDEARDIGPHPLRGVAGHCANCGARLGPGAQACRACNRPVGAPVASAVDAGDDGGAEPARSPSAAYYGRRSPDSLSGAAGVHAVATEPARSAAQGGTPWTPSRGSPGAAAIERPTGVTLAAIFLIVMGVLQILAGAGCGLVGGRVNDQFGSWDSSGAVGTLGIGVAALGVIVLLVGVAGIVAAAGIMQAKGWGRTTGIIVSIVAIIAFTLGALGTGSIDSTAQLVLIVIAVLYGFTVWALYSSAPYFSR